MGAVGVHRWARGKGRVKVQPSIGLDRITMAWIAGLLPLYFCLFPHTYSFPFSSYSGFSSLRLGIMSVLSALWGARLTFNFYRKGGYSAGEQDYRWPIVRSYVKSEIVWQLFNLTFIAFYQQVGGRLPTILSGRGRGRRETKMTPPPTHPEALMFRHVLFVVCFSSLSS